MKIVQLLLVPPPEDDVFPRTLPNANRHACSFGVCHYLFILLSIRDVWIARSNLVAMELSWRFAGRISHIWYLHWRHFSLAQDRGLRRNAPDFFYRVWPNSFIFYGNCKSHAQSALNFSLSLP